MRLALVGVLAACSGVVGEPNDPTGPDAGIADAADFDAMVGAPTAAELLARLATCNKIGGNYATDSGKPETIPICGLSDAVAWTSDMDVDCDGAMSPQCNLSADPDYQNSTAASDSHGHPLDAATLPYVVIPGKSTRFDYRAAGLSMGSIVAVIFHDRVAYGPLGDVGPIADIGEASYAMAVALGIDPNPSTGGTDSGVTYIAFTGTDGKLPVIEDRAAAATLGVERASLLLSQ